MKLENLNLNRLLIKTENSNLNSNSDTSSSISVEQESANVFRKKNTNNSDANTANENDDAQNILTGTVIVSCFIKTSNLPSRVELSGNDIRLYDDSSSVNGVVTGDTAKITFLNSDGTPGNFVMQKRSGKDFTLDNVMEFFYEDSPVTRFNYMYFGRRGDNTDYKTNYIEFTSDHDTSKEKVPANGQVSINLSKNGIPYTKSRIALIHGDAFLTPSGEGAKATIEGEGDAGGVQLGYWSTAGVLQSYIVLDKDGIQYSQAGRVSAAGVASAKFPPNWSVAHTATGFYTITHNLGHSNYAVTANGLDNASAIAGIRTIRSTTFVITILDVTGTPQDCAFCFSVF